MLVPAPEEPVTAMIGCLLDIRVSVLRYGIMPAGRCRKQPGLASPALQKAGARGIIKNITH